MTTDNDSGSRPHLATLAVRGGEPAAHGYSAVTTPIVCTATYSFASSREIHDLFQGRVERPEYGRYGNPTVEVAERKIASLEGAEGGVLFPSGMNAITTLFLSMLRPGDHVVLTSDCYRRTRHFVSPQDREGLERAVSRPGTRLLFSEAPTNPFVRVVDIPYLAELCRKNTRVKLVIDSTLGTPINVRPVELGADLVVHSCSKYLGGHNDLLAGALVGSRGLTDALREARGLFGGMPDPHGAYLLIRGLKTLPLRMRQHNDSGDRVARFLEQHRHVARVFYPGLSSHPDHAAAASQFSGFGGVMSLLVDGDLEATSRFIDHLRLATIGPSMGGAETLIEQPALMSFYELEPAAREELGIADNLVRLSVGLEDPEELCADLAQALEAAFR
jgi:cystathionine gamma-synthase